MTVRKLWGVYRKQDGECHAVFVHFADEQDGEMVAAYEMRGDAKDEAARRNQARADEIARETGQGSLFND